MKRFFLLLCALIVFAAPLNAFAETTAPHTRVQQIMDDILSFHVRSSGADSIQGWLDTALAEGAGMGAEWYVIALGGGYDYTAYQQKLRAYLDSTAVRAATSRQKYALAFLASGIDDPYVHTTLEDSIGQQGVTSWIWGLHLLTNGCESTAATADSAVDTLLSLQLPDGGWALRGDVSDVDVTAMALQALAPHTQREDVASAAEKAVELLSLRQMEDGGYASYGAPNPESAAQVMIALSALNIDALQDERFIKDGADLLTVMQRYQLPDGSFSHTLGGTYSAPATAQVFCALSACQRFLGGMSPLYVLDSFTPAEPAVSAKASLDFHAVAAIVIAGAALLVCIVLLILKKCHWKNFAAVLIAAALAIVFVMTTDFQSADTYYTTVAVTKDNAIGSVTMTIRCETVAGQADYIPADGVILPETTFPIAQGDTVYAILTEAARAHSIPLENTGAKGMAYVAGIGHLYEYSFGNLSGWVYRVDGESQSVGCDQYVLQDGQTIEWLYTLELGQDLN